MKTTKNKYMVLEVIHQFLRRMLIGLTSGTFLCLECQGRGNTRATIDHKEFCMIDEFIKKLCLEDWE